MKKRLVILLLILFIPFIRVNAAVFPVEKYVDGKPYYSDHLIIDSWCIDNSTNQYIKTDKNGNILFKTDNPNDDPISAKGNLTITADVPGTIYDEDIEVLIFNSPYQYSFILNKDNKFKVEAEVIEGTYEVTYVGVKNHFDDYRIDYPSTINIYKQKNASINLDYSQYRNTNPSGKKKNNKVIIIYIVIGIAIVFIIAFIIMIIKARNV